MNAREKKRYVKPRLRSIELETKEVMGVGCKTPTGIPNSAEKVPGCGIPSFCLAEGS